MIPDNTATEDVAIDILAGAEAIAEFVFGTKKARRRVYAFACETKGPRLPCFRLGGLLCARKSTLLRWIAAQEAKNAA